MKMIIKITSITTLAALICGCAQVGPSMISPAVYKSSEKAAVAGNQSREAQLLENKNNSAIEIARDNAWNQMALNEIQGKATASGGKDQATAAITSDGVRGGFECLFINDTPRRITIIATKKGGFMAMQKFNIRVEKNARRPFKLFAGQYRYVWLVDDIYYTRLGGGPCDFEVTVYTHYYDSVTDTSYHGGALVFGGY